MVQDQDMWVEKSLIIFMGSFIFFSIIGAI